MPDITELLSQVPLLQGLPEADLCRLAEHTRSLRFDPGEEIVGAGESGRALYVLLDGEVKVLMPGSGAELELARLGPGDFFGELALLTEHPRTATVRSIGPVQALALERTGFREVVRERPQLALDLLAGVSARIRSADRQISALSDLSTRDPLTRLPNRTAFQEATRREIDRIRRYGGVASLVVLEVDELQPVDDTLGYERGDEVVGWVGRVVSEHTRSADCLFRLGARRFAVLCPAIEGEAAHAVARRLVEVVAEARPPMDRPPRVTVSAGYATCPRHGEELDELLLAASKALDRALAGAGNPASATGCEEAVH